MRYDIHLLHRLRRIIGKNIHAARARKKLPLWKLAALTELSHQRLDYYELGGDAINLNDLFKIACVLDVPLVSLFQEGGL